MDEPHTGFRDPTDLTKWTKGFLYASIPLAVLSVAGSWRNYWWHANTGEPPPSLEGPFVGLVVIFAVPVLVVMLGTAILVLMWIHRANYNARALGATRMEFTPGWAVGWYFIPIANFWKPYQAMKEICRASLRPSRWWEEKAPSLLPLWWGLWLLSSGAGGISWTASTEEVESVSEIVRQALNIPLALVLIRIISQVHLMQMAHYRTRDAEESDHE